MTALSTPRPHVHKAREELHTLSCAVPQPPSFGAPGRHGQRHGRGLMHSLVALYSITHNLILRPSFGCILVPCHAALPSTVTHLSPNVQFTWCHRIHAAVG